MRTRAFFLCGASLLAGPAAAAGASALPPRLEDFRIDNRGTVTRPAEPTPAPAPAPAPTPAPAPAPAPAPTTDPASRAEQRPSAAAPRPQLQPAPAPTTPLPSPEVAEPEPVPAPVETAPSPTVEQRVPTSAADSPTTPVQEEAASTPVPSADGPLWPWLLLPLALLGIGFAAWRRRPRPAPASISVDLSAGTETRDLAGPILAEAPTSQPAPAAEAPPIATPEPVAAVTRAQIELTLEPQGATLNEGELEVRFILNIRNIGDAPAQDLRLASKLLSGGREIETVLHDFYADPLDAAVRLPQTVPPGVSGALRGRVRLKTEEMKLLTVQDRRLLVPLIAVNLRYRWADGEGQTAQSFVVGRELDPPTSRMAPLPVTSPPRVYKGLGTRPHQLALVA